MNMRNIIESFSDKKDFKAIYKIIIKDKLNKKKFTENNSRMYINLSELSDETYDEINSYIKNYKKEQNKKNKIIDADYINKPKPTVTKKNTRLTNREKAVINSSHK